MRFATVWKYCQQHWFQNMTQEVPCVVTGLLSHQINNLESISSPNNGQHEFLGPDLLFHLLGDIISQYAPFRRKTEFQSESTPQSPNVEIYFSREP
jgi:hypothetical protein